MHSGPSKPLVICPAGHKSNISCNHVLGWNFKSSPFRQQALAGLGSCNIIHLIIHLDTLKKKPVLFTQLPVISLQAVRPESETIRMLIKRRLWNLFPWCNFSKFSRHFYFRHMFYPPPPCPPPQKGPPLALVEVWDCCFGVTTQSASFLKDNVSTQHGALHLRGTKLLEWKHYSIQGKKLLKEMILPETDTALSIVT